MKKVFICSYETNYNLGACVIVAEDIEKAKAIAENSTIVWAGYSLEEVEMNKQIQVITEEGLK